MAVITSREETLLILLSINRYMEFLQRRISHYDRIFDLYKNDPNLFEEKCSYEGQLLILKSLHNKLACSLAVRDME